MGTVETIEGGLARAVAKRAKGDGMPSETDPTVYARIKAMILDGTVPPGERITIDRMARELGVSQTPVREAMQRLEGDKLVRTRQPRGYATTPLLTKRDLEMMIEVRLLLEPWAARMAAVDRASNPGRALLAEIDAFSGRPGGGGADAAGTAETAGTAGAAGAAGTAGTAGYRAEQAGSSDWKHELFQHDTRFHLLILEATGNSFLIDAYRQMHPHLHLFRLYPGDPHGTDTSHEHAEIAAAIAACDPDAAEAAMREHILRALSRFSASTSDGVGSGAAGEGSNGAGGGKGASAGDADGSSEVRRDLADTYASVLGSMPGIPDAGSITLASEGRNGHAEDVVQGGADGQGSAAARDAEGVRGGAGAKDGRGTTETTDTREQAG